MPLISSRLEGAATEVFRPPEPPDPAEFRNPHKNYPACRDLHKSSGSKRVIEHLLQTLSLAEHYEDQDPPNPITLAALQSSMHDLIADLETTGLLIEPNSLK
jgi:hypothetical protein